MTDPPAITLLGPQLHQPTLADALTAAGVDPEAPVAVVTAGWQDREAEDEGMAEHLRRPIRNLSLWRRTQDLDDQDPELADALHRRQDRLRQLQRVYDLRVGLIMEAAVVLAGLEGDDDLMTEERAAALDAVRSLDLRHLRRVGEAHAAFEAEVAPAERPSVQAHREDLRAMLAGAAALCIAGGNVSTVLNRLRLFDLRPLVGDLPVVAWSAGAMALTDRVVVFHDDPPHGQSFPRLLEHGLGWASGLVLLPHARERLRLDDPVRVGLMARRFAPAACLGLDAGAAVRWQPSGWEADGALRLGHDGDVAALGSSVGRAA